MKRKLMALALAAAMTVSMTSAVFAADEIKSVDDLTGKKIGAYYGCLLLRPGRVMQMDNPENPKILEDFIKAIGGEPVIYNQRNECCGAYLTAEDPSVPEKRSKKILYNAAENGAELLVTACPLCLYNLNKNQQGENLPVVYFTELLAQALGVSSGSDVGGSDGK